MAVDLSKLSAAIDALTAAVNAVIANPPSDAGVQSQVDALTAKVQSDTTALTPAPAPTTTG